jgi:branched-chain amino acid aminotransferase
MEIKKMLTAHPKTKPADESALGFGQIFTDHMLTIDYDEQNGWHNAQIIPYGPLALDPAATCLHYSQEIFEGMKAYKSKDGRVILFRPWENFKRLNVSAKRLMIPELDEKMLLDSLIELIRIEKDWIPTLDGASLYIRPFIIGVDPKLGVKASSTYKYLVILSPSGPYYKGGFKPAKFYVEDQYVRAVRGGTGDTKTGGNYANGLRVQEEAAEKGYYQVLWLDGVHRKYIEEAGAMNVFFVIGGEVVTPKLNGSILPGITRKSVIELGRSWGLAVSEREISIDEIVDAHQSGKLTECFASGTAAVIFSIGELYYKGQVIRINNGAAGELALKFYQTLTDIQYGRAADTLGWTLEII